MQGFESGNLGRQRGRCERKPGAAALTAVVALVVLAPLACSSGKAEHSAGEDQATVVSGSNPTASPTTSDQAPSRFVGEWAAADYNEQFSISADKPSFQTMTIRAGEGGVLRITVHGELVPSECWEKRSGRATNYSATTVTGTGLLEDPTTLVVSSPALACDDGSDARIAANQLGVISNYTLVLDLATDRLYDNLGLVWNRGAPPKKRADRSMGAGAKGPGPIAILSGEVTFREAGPWNDTVESGLDARSFYLIGPGDGGGEAAYIEILVNPLPEPCDGRRVPPSAEGLVRAIRSNPDLEATVPVTERLGGIDALRMDVVAAPGASSPCAELPGVVVVAPGLEPGGLGRFYVLDLPGGSARTLAILITAPEALFERAIDAAAPVLESFRFHSTERFDSPLNGLSIGYPSGWRTRAATEPWAGHSDVAFGAPDVDVIFHPKLKDDLYLAMVSEPLGGTAAQDWVDSGSWLPSVGICTDAYGAGGGSDTFHGNDAWFEGCSTPVGSDGFVVFGTATRGYIINLHVGDGRAERAERRILQATYGGDWFEAGILETVQLPEDALDASSPSESP